MLNNNEFVHKRYNFHVKIDGAHFHSLSGVLMKLLTERAETQLTSGRHKTKRLHLESFRYVQEMQIGVNK